MLSALSGYGYVSQAAVSSSPPPAVMAATASTASALNRATAPDTVTISAAGQQASQAAQDVDHDGDSH